MRFWNRRVEVSPAQWMLYGLLEMGAGAIVTILFTSRIRKSVLNKAFESGRVCGKVEMTADVLKKYFEAEKKEEKAE